MSKNKAPWRYYKLRILEKSNTIYMDLIIYVASLPACELGLSLDSGYNNYYIFLAFSGKFAGETGKETKKW